MSIVLGCFKTGSFYSYQHLHGLMLVNLNKLSFELNLSHQEYRVMGVLIGLWNQKYQKAFPTIDYLAENCCMGKQTIIKILKRLSDLNFLIIDKYKNFRNNYYFSNLILPKDLCNRSEPVNSIACSTAHDIKPIKKKKPSIILS